MQLSTLTLKKSRENVFVNASHDVVERAFSGIRAALISTNVGVSVCFLASCPKYYVNESFVKQQVVYI